MIDHPDDLMRVPNRPNRSRKHLDGLQGILLKSAIKPHPTNPHGVLVPCATCGKEIHVPRDDFTKGGVDPANLTCSFDCMTANQKERLMTTYPYAAKVDPEIKQTIALAMEAAHMDWEKDGHASPSPLDYVRIADLLLMEQYKGYVGSTPEGRDFIADCWDTIDDDAGWGEIAEAVVDQLVAE